MPTKKQIYEEKKAKEDKAIQEQKLNEQLKNVTGSVTFNKDKSVNVDGNVLTREEYNTFKDKSKLQYGGGGDVLEQSQLSPNVSDLLRSQYEGILRRNATMSATKGTIAREVLEKEKVRQGLTPETQNIQNETIPSQVTQNQIPQEQANLKGIDAIKEASPAIKEALRPIEIVEAFVYGDKKQVENLTPDSVKVLGGIASIYYQLKSQGKPLKQQEFESALTEEKKDIMKYIEYSSQGLISPYDVEKKIQTFNQVLTEYERWNKLEGKANVRYLILQGSDTQRAINDGYDDIETFRLLLNRAAVQSVAKEQAIQNELALSKFGQ